MHMFNDALDLMQSRGAIIADDVEYADWPLSQKDSQLLTISRDVDMIKSTSLPNLAGVLADCVRQISIISWIPSSHHPRPFTLSKI